MCGTLCYGLLLWHRPGEDLDGSEGWAQWLPRIYSIPLLRWFGARGWFVQRRILADVGWPEPLERFIVLVGTPLVSKALAQATSQKGEQDRQTDLWVQ